MSSDITPTTVGSPGTGPRSRATSAWPGAPGVPGGVKSAETPPIKSGVVGENDFLEGGPVDTPVRTAFPGTTGANWQDWQTGGDAINASTTNDEPGHVSGGLRVSHPDAFPGGGQGV